MALKQVSLNDDSFDLSIEEGLTLPNGTIVVNPTQIKMLSLLLKLRPEGVQVTEDGGENDRYDLTEDGMSRLFADLFNEDLLWCPEKKTWYMYNGTIWEQDISGALTLKRTHDYYAIMQLYIPCIEDPSTQENWGKYVYSRLSDTRYVERILKKAKGYLTVPMPMLDADSELINMPSYTLNLNTYKLQEHNPRDYLTKLTRCDLPTTNPESLKGSPLKNHREAYEAMKHEKWTQFIYQVMEGDEEKSRYLQKALGYSILGNPKEECMFILHGKTTRNGKSTLLNTINHLMGDYSTVTTASIICRAGFRKNASQASPEIAGLKGKRFVSMSESSKYGKLDEDTIKILTGGEEIVCRGLYENISSYVPQFVLWLSCNDLPDVEDKSLFASDRLRIIEFNKHFSRKEQNKNLKNEFQTEEQMYGIFWWLLEGLKLYRQEGLDLPDSMQQVVDRYETNNDLVLMFLEDCCEPAEKESVQGRTLYSKYKSWAKASGYTPLTAQKFNAEMQIHKEWYSSYGKSNGYPTYKGVRIRV